jgi:pyrimidine operon attenuation protein/uracil phosphoribosyltransferase
MENRVLLNDAEIERTITRIAREISEKVDKIQDLALLGIRSRGAYLVRRIVKKIETAAGLAPHFGEIDITPYRDDLAGRLTPDSIPLSIAIDDKTVVLIDDVEHGWTVRAALELVTRMGKPAKILLAVLVDRGNRQLPIRADIVGKNIQVEVSERVNVLLKESDGFDRVTVSTAAA